MTLFRYFAPVILTLLCTVGPVLADTSPTIQARVYYDSKDTWFKLRHMHLDKVWDGNGYIEIITDRAELDEIGALGFKTEIVHPDLPQFFRSRMPDKAMGAYKTLSEIYQYRDSVIAANPDIISQIESIGQTIEGRDIWAFKISDNPDLDEDEPEILYGAAIHAREVITPEVLFYFIDHLTQNYGIDPDITDLVNNREMWFILVINPDGYYHNEVIEPGGGGMWRKNRRDNGDGNFGVDLNRNFGYMWGYDDEGSSPYTDDETYRGTGPFSEPETQHIRDFISAHEFVITVYYHSHSNLIIWPWSYDRFYCDDEEVYAAIGDSGALWNGYDPGPGWILYVVNGGSDDWGYGEQTLKNKNFSFTVEVGSYEDNFWPPAERIDDLISENLGANLFYARAVGDIYALASPAAPVLTVPDTVPGTAYTIEWSHDDTLNPATYFELVEMTDRQVITDSANSFDEWVNAEFELSDVRYNSSPTSFYSGADDKSIKYVQSVYPYPVETGDSLKIDMYYDIEDSWDYAYVEVSTDGNLFTPIPGNVTTDSDPYGNNRGNGITGASGGDWVLALFDLSEYVGKEVFIRVSYYTDQYVLEEGIYIDDIHPHIIFGNSVSFYPISDTSHTMTDKAEGDYYYKVRAQDAEFQLGAYSDVVKTVAAVPFVCGDANSDGSCDVADAVYLINYVFKGGPAPDPLAAGDANGDEEINIADGVYVINYVFKSGPEPVCP
jgi:hypothetical protein